MAANQNTLWERFLRPVLTPFLNAEEIERQYKRIDWEVERDRVRNPNLTYPEYYTSQNFHGISEGYLNPRAAVTYDPITQYVLPPNELWVRQSLIGAIGGTPRRILDLGCGTGSTTLLLKQTFPHATVIGVDLSPYMLIMAAEKAKKAGLTLDWRHDKAESTRFPNHSFDLVTASLLFHETPPHITQSILREAFRLLVPNGQVIILDGNQKTLRFSPWLTEVFEEPYIQDYAQGDLEVWMRNAGFEGIKTEDFWLIHQVTRGMKPHPIQSPETRRGFSGMPSPA